MRRINRVQRLARREEKDIVKRIFLLSAISVVLIFILLTIGVSALGNLAELLDKVFKADTQESQDNSLTVPILNNTSDVTNKELVTISGFSAGGDKVEIYLDGNLAGEAVVESGKFEHEITLKEGENSVNAKAVAGENISDFSQTITLTLDKKEPSLEITAPSNDQSFFGDNRIKVEGKTEGDAQVFVNGFLANVSAAGEFDVMIPLSEGENEIEVKALDEAGNSKTEKIKVNFRK